MRLLAGLAGKADEFVTHGTFDAKTLKTNGASFKDVIKPVEKAGLMQDFRILLVAKRAVELHERGIETGIELKDAKKAIQEVETPLLQKSAKEMYGYLDRLLRYAVDSKLLGEEDYSRIAGKNKNYVPYQRVQDEAGGGGKKTGSAGGPLVVGIKGSARQIIDPLEQALKLSSNILRAADRNTANLALTEQADSTEGMGKWVERLPPEMAPKQFRLSEITKHLDDAGIKYEKDSPAMENLVSIFRPDVKPSPRENIIVVQKEGKPVAYKIDPELYRSIDGLDKANVDIITELLSKPASVMRAGATGLNASFIIPNVARDMIVATAQSPNGFNPLHAVGGLVNHIGGTELYHEWRRGGGDNAAAEALYRTTLQNNLKELLMNPVKFHVMHPVEAMRVLSGASEVMTRLGEFTQAKKSGKSIRGSAFDSREVTVDFGRIGLLTRAVNMTIPFSNVAAQGSDRLIRAFKDNPKRTSLKALVGVTLPTLMIYALNKDDEKYKDLPAWQRDLFWMIPTKGTALEEQTDYIRIPKPFQLGVLFGSAVERGLEFVNTKDPKAFDGYLDSLLTVTLPSFAFAALMPMIEVQSNYSFFTKQPVVPGYLQRLPEEYQFEPYTTELAKGLARMGRQVGINASPIKWEHVMRGYTAGAGMDFARTVADPAIKAVTGEGTERPTKTLADYPVVRSFVVRKGGRTRSMTKFYERLGALEKKNAAKSFAKRYPGRFESKAMTAAERQEHTILKHAQGRVAKYLLKIRRTEGGKLTGDQKRKRIDDLKTQRAKLVSDTMKRVGGIQKKGDKVKP